MNPSTPIETLAESLDSAFPVNYPYFDEDDDSEDNSDCMYDESLCDDDSLGDEDADEFASEGNGQDNRLADRTSEILQNYRAFLHEYDVESAAHELDPPEDGRRDLQYHEHRARNHGGTDKATCLLRDFSMPHASLGSANSDRKGKRNYEMMRPLLGSKRVRFGIFLSLGMLAAIVVVICAPTKGTTNIGTSDSDPNRFAEVAYVLGREEGHEDETLPHHSSIIPTNKLLTEPVNIDEKESESNDLESASTAPIATGTAAPLNDAIPTFQIGTAENFPQNEEISIKNKDEVVEERTEAPVNIMASATSHIIEPASTATAATSTAAPIDMIQIVHEEFKPLWFGSGEGWNGGSPEDAVEFCRSIRGKEICPYSVMCPNGPGQSLMAGRRPVDFSGEGEQYAPATILSHTIWVMVGVKDGDLSTTCMPQEQLEMNPSSWDLSAEFVGERKHIMCCTIPPEV
ncbi:hypothetical protein ACHAW5_005813 [Stephanodiscus triporus]|uniref:DUF7495 domain-containing protein n=1 Tax=Stephanodiscus triporus TaxID=2934178 RepID=A0ABD3PXR6_9STRA